MRHEFVPKDDNIDICEFCTQSYADHFTDRIGVYDEDEIYGTEYLDLSGYAPIKEEW